MRGQEHNESATYGEEWPGLGHMIRVLFTGLGADMRPTIDDVGFALANFGVTGRLIRGCIVARSAADMKA